MELARSFAILVLFGGFVAACSSTAQDETPSTSDCNVAIERFKELVIVDDAVMNDGRASNERNGVWSFRHALEAMVPEGTSPSKFLSLWFDDWATTEQVNGFATNREPRAAAMNERLVCPWLRATPANSCDADCKTCQGRTLDLAKAPFRLIAISNRMDLRTRPDATSPAGEGRLLFALTDGPADDARSKPFPLTLIFEYALPRSKPIAEWAQTWHRLGLFSEFGEAYRSELERVTESFVARNASPERVSGSALSQARTNESVFNWIWQMRQFELDASGQLRLAPVTNTPGEPLNNSSVLRDFVIANKDQVLAGTHVLPRSLTAGSSDQLLFRWNVPEVDERVRAAFAGQTCNGCHSGENTPVDTAFHVSPFRTGVAKLSSFLNDPQNPAKDELAVREQSTRHALCPK